MQIVLFPYLIRPEIKAYAVLIEHTSAQEAKYNVRFISMQRFRTLGTFGQRSQERGQDCER